MVKKRDFQKKDLSGASDFDRFWQRCFEELGGKKDLPAHLKASYPTEEIFQLRDTFIRHLLARSLDGRAAGCSCLDVGCNAGLYAKLLHDYGMNVCGIDTARSLLEEAKETHPFIDFIHASAYSLPIGDNSVDVVTSFGLIQCLSDWRRVLDEIVRVLRPGGIALVTTNRVFRFPLVEKVLRNIRWFMKGTITFRELRGKFRMPARTSGTQLSLPSYPPARHRIEDIVAYLKRLPVERIVVHDPVKIWPVHEFLWGVAFTKSVEQNLVRSQPMTIDYCSLCRSPRKWKK